METVRASTAWGTGSRALGGVESLADSIADRLAGSIADRSAGVGVIGLGYVGLPLVEAVAAAGFATLGFDTDAAKVDRLAGGRSTVGTVADARVEGLVAGGRFAATADLARLAEPDVILICVPTPLGKHREPDLSAVTSTGAAIARSLRPGQLVVLESTTYPGTTTDVLQPILEESGLVAGVDFFLAYSPEREDPGDPRHSATRVPKVVGGVDAESARLARLVYEAVAPEVVAVSSCEVAEACKILENTYRAVNIALVNELKLIFERMGVDIWEVVDAAATKPFGFQRFNPGPGLGGHCIPIDPFYLTWAARAHGIHTRLIELAGEINTAMPRHVVSRVVEALNERGRAVRGARILVLGAAYKPDVDDCRESPAVALMEELDALGAMVAYHDPHVPALPPLRGRTLRLGSVVLSAPMLGLQDCVVIATDHAAIPWPLVVDHARLVVDTRGVARRLPTPHRAAIVTA